MRLFRTLTLRFMISPNMRLTPFEIHVLRLTYTGDNMVGSMVVAWDRGRSVGVSTFLLSTPPSLFFFSYPPSSLVSVLFCRTYLIYTFGRVFYF